MKTFRLRRIIETLSTTAALLTAIVGVLEAVMLLLPQEEDGE